MILSGFSAFAQCSLKHKKTSGLLSNQKWDKKPSHELCAHTQ